MCCAVASASASALSPVVSTGPHTWARLHPFAGGTNQSPVNIEVKNVVYDPKMEQHGLRLHQSTSSNAVLINYGRSFRLEMDTDANVSGGPLKAAYSFGQMHMHWGLSRHYGSEHAINGITYAAELHIVFFDKRRFASLTEAIRSCEPDALCVLGVLIEEGNADVAIEPIVQYLPKISYRDQKVPIPEHIRLDSLLPRNRQEYYTYPGSLTTPPCSEIVQWIVYRHHITMSDRQLNKCRTIHDTAENSMSRSCCVNNYRTYCPLGSRIVRSSFKIEK